MQRLEANGWAAHIGRFGGAFPGEAWVASHARHPKFEAILGVQWSETERSFHASAEYRA